MSLAPGLSRLLAHQPAPVTSLWIPPGTLRSLRGIETLSALEHLALPAAVPLTRLVRLPALRALNIEGGPRPERPVRLAPLAGAPALESLLLYNLSRRTRDTEILATLPALRSVEICGGPCPDLRPLARTLRPLERLDLDGVSDVRLHHLAGLGVRFLDLWGCGLSRIDTLATMPRLEEVWLQGNPLTSLRPLLHLSAGARVYLGEEVDPERHHAELRALEARGVWVMIAADPSEHGIQPSWWGGHMAPVPEEDRRPIRYQSPDHLRVAPQNRVD